MTSPFGKVRHALALFLVIFAASLLMAQRVRDGSVPAGQKLVPNGDGSAKLVPDSGATPTGDSVSLGNGINYNGGPVMKGTVNAYVIWYGNWNGTGSDTPATQSTIEHFLATIGGSALELVNTTYGDTTGDVSGLVNFAGSTTNTSTKNLTDRGVQSVVANAIKAGALPKDANGVYFVLTSSGVNETSGFCTVYCGWHTHATVNGVDIKYAFVGNTDRCPSACSIQPTGPNSPAANVGGIDGMANIISHELEEAISDPDLNAWFDVSGNENADKCNFNFGPTSTCNANGLCTPAGTAAAAKYNQTFGNNDWMLQQNWRNSAGGACAQHL